MGRLWAGINTGKEHHWAAGIDEESRLLFSHRVANDEIELLRLITEAEAVGDERLWAVDIPGGVANLSLVLLWSAGEGVLYLPGVAVNRSRDAYRGEAKTDARDARIIAEQARRRDLAELRPSVTVLAELALVGVFPGLECVLDLTTKGALLLVCYRTPSDVRRVGAPRLEAYLRARGCRKAPELVQRALAAAAAQRLSLPAEEVSAAIVSDLAAEVLPAKERLARLDEGLERRPFCHPQTEILLSLPGTGTRLGAEFLVAVGELAAFGCPDQLAAYAGLVHDSGKRTGSLRRIRGGNKDLKRVFYQSAFASLRDPSSRAFYERKRGEGIRHHQAVIALARRRVNVIWAMLGDETMFQIRRSGLTSS